MSENNDLKPQPPAELARPEMRDKPTVILGGGPAGLTAGYVLAKQGLPVIVLEAEDQVGGIAKTAVRDGYRFDLGGHRFFTKVREIDDLWHEIMKEGVPRAAAHMSRIYWRAPSGEGKFLDYPLRGPDVMKKLGPVDLTKALFSYLWAALKPKGKRTTSSSGSRTASSWLFNQFFKSYTEKVWGVPTSEIPRRLGQQRIKNLSFFRAAWSPSSATRTTRSPR